MMGVDLFGDIIAEKRAAGAHESAVGGTDEWLTPPELVAALGTFDLDPCSPTKRPWPTAERHLTIEDDGLRHEWSGRVWLNPPYASAGVWMRRMADHGHGTALLFARTKTAMWHEHIWPHATAMLFLRGRLSFYSAQGRKGSSNAGAPSVLIAYGQGDAAALRDSGIAGRVVDLTGNHP